MINGTKTEFLRVLGDWIELTPLTASALTNTVRAHTVLTDDLLRLINQYVITARLQSDPVSPSTGK